MTVSPPAANPWDTAQVASDALAILRLKPEDPDSERVVDAAVVATGAVDQLLDHPEPMETIPDPVNYAAVLVTMELYRRKDAPFGVLNAWSVDDVITHISAETLRSVRRLIYPFKARWGVG